MSGYPHMRDIPAMDRDLDHHAVPTGRRECSRLRVRLPIKAVTRKGTYTAVLCDLSLAGARIEPNSEIVRGEEVLLQWGEHEAFGIVVRRGHGGLGIAFYDPIDPAVLLSTRVRDDRHHLPCEWEQNRRAARAFVGGRR